jgi:L-alanine-DL-glutamate epimerase-like enolase superfamily enzyme
MSAHLCAAVPNFRIMEYEVEDAPWLHDFVTHPPVVAGGALVVPTRPGWGADVNGDALRARPPRKG